MAKQHIPKPAKKSVSKPKSTGGTFYNHVYVLCGILVCTLIVYLGPALGNQLTNWDDNLYVSQNQLIATWSLQFLTARVNANWAPMHELLITLEYHLFKLAPAGYHLVSLLLHVGNMILVYVLTFKWSKKYIVAGATAFFFAIHPMHAEPVLWVSAQKDLLFTLFYLAAMLTYTVVQERRDDSGKPYIPYLALTMLFFMLSCLSKGMGETLPVVLVLMDCFRANNWNWQFMLRSAVNKIVFFLASIAFGITAYLALKNGGALDAISTHSFGEQIMFSCYGLLVYVVKFVFPLSLSPFYAYPLKGSTGSYPLIYYISPVILLLLMGSAVWFILWRKKKKQPVNILLFGLLFFLTNLLLVLQVKTITNVILAERYTYLAYMGLLFISADALNTFWETGMAQAKRIIMIVLGMVAILFALTAHNFGDTWYDSISLWTYVINQYQSTPVEDLHFAYYNRGLAYEKQNNSDQALADYNVAINLAPYYADTYNNRGLTYAHHHKPEQAIADFDTTIRLQPKYFAPYYNRGLVYASERKPEQAISDYNTAIGLNPDFTDAYNDRGLAYANVGKTDLALADYNKAISMSPQFMLPHYNRGLIYFRQNQFERAIADYDTAINLNPRYVDIYNDRGRAYVRLGKTDLAMADFNTAISLNPRFALPYYNRGLIYAQQGQTDLAINDYTAATNVDPQFSYAFHDRGLAEELKGNHVQAQMDFEKANALGWSPPK